MTKTLVFSGHSDDVFNIEGGGTREPDEIGCFSGHAAVRVVDDDGHGLVVTAGYAPKYVEGAAWVIGLTLLDEDKPLPPWGIEWGTADNGYSPTLTIHASDSAKVSRISGDD